MDLKCWGEGWGLPTVDIDCLSVLSYAYFAKVPFNLTPSLPRNTIAGTLPELRQGDLLYSRAFNIIGIFRREGYNADYGLTDDQNADTLAYLSFIEQKLKPAILYTLWLDAANYTKVTRPTFGKLCGLPWSLWYPSHMRRFVEQKIIHSKGANLRLSFADVEKILYKEAQHCLNILEEHLGTSLFFYGDNPTTFDAILYGHLGILLKAPLSATGLQNHLHACEKLKGFCFRMERFFPQSSTTTSKVHTEKESFTKSDIIISIGVAAAAMIVYALTSGVLTEKRSKLAEKLGTVQEKRYTDIDDVD